MKLEKNIPHNCNDLDIIAWCAENLETRRFQPGQGNFGCSCDVESPVYFDLEYQHQNNENVIARYIRENEIELIRVYYCEKCHEWALDDDFDNH